MGTTTKEKQKRSRLQWKWFLIRQLQFLLDLLIFISAFVLAYLLRFDFAVPQQEISSALVQLPVVVVIQLAALYLAGVHMFIWRYIGMVEMKAFVYAALLSTLPVVAVRVGASEEFEQWRVPLSIIVMDTILGFGGVLSLRLLRRAFHERHRKSRSEIHSDMKTAKPVLLIGAGRAGMMAVKEILNRSDSELKIKGFVDDDPNKQKSVIYGVRVLGTTQDLPRLVREHGIDHVIISIAHASRRDFRRILDLCKEISVKVQVIPGFYEILQGRVNVSRVRDVQIEDLLGRDPVSLDEEGIRKCLTGKTVMVTGAGGSIGSELVRQVARFKPSCLLLVERAEFALFNIDREMRDAWPDLPLVTLIADVGDEHRMRAIFTAHRPQIVLHAAAHKHVPMMEANPCEAVRNNLLATRSLGDLAGKFEAEVFVLISTDKAVRPTSVMGATKRAAELVVQDLNRRYRTRYVAVRFGNVIGSAGSVIPIFREQILKGGPVKVTHPDMMRYFMTIPEAAQLVLQAGAMGEVGEIFILDMGEPVRILDLAKDTITLSGFKPYEDMDIVFTGLRPGEKLYEELEMTEEKVTQTRHPKILICKIAAYPEERVRQALEKLSALAKAGKERELRKALNELLPEARLKDFNGNGATSAAAATTTVSGRLLQEAMPKA